jgi:glyoxylase-like metal-dependent hydrolase (beta-lactamase superfamily II)
VVSRLRVGRLAVDAISDGTFVMRPWYFGEALSPAVRPDFFDREGRAVLPIGSFVIRGNGRVVLVDAGLGPKTHVLPHGMSLVGGQLLEHLAAVGVKPSAVTDVVCTHLHSDHVGWLFNERAEPVFSSATVWFGAADWDAFVTGAGECAPHIRAGFLGDTHEQMLRFVDQQTELGPGVRARPAPGHTPGSLVVEVASAGDRLLLVGDAITCPIQLEQPTWHSFGDLDVAMAEKTRRQLWSELAAPRTRGVGAHFPALSAGRVMSLDPGIWVASPDP